MTFVGKLLVVVQLVLSVCFMTFAGAVYTKHVTWKAQYDAEKAKVAQLETDLKGEAARRTADTDSANKRIKESDDKAKAANNELALSVEQVKKQGTEIQRLNSVISDESALRKSAQEEASIRKNEATLLTQINSTLIKELNQKNTIVASQAEELFNRSIKVKELSEKHDDLLGQVAVFTKVLASNGFSTDPKSYSKIAAPTPLVFGEVEEADPKGKGGVEHVQVSIGSDDGLTENTILYVYRVGERSKFLAQIRLTLVTPDKAVGIVVPGTKNGVIEKGDYVSTKL